MWLHLCHCGEFTAAKPLLPLWFFWTVTKSLLNLPFHKLMNQVCQPSQSDYISNKVPKEEIMSPHLQTWRSHFLFWRQCYLESTQCDKQGAFFSQSGCSWRWHSPSCKLSGILGSWPCGFLFVFTVIRLVCMHPALPKKDPARAWKLAALAYLWAQCRLFLCFLPNHWW